MKRTRSVHYALLGVVSQNPEGVHGYELRRQCDRVLGSLWKLRLGEVYRVLDGLARDGLIEQAELEAGSSRKLYRITEKGRRSLEAFVLEPPKDAPRPLRQELAVKLLFAGQERMRDVLLLIDQQREAYLRELHLLGVQRRRLRNASTDTFVTSLLIDGAELTVRAELTWLDDVAHKLKERIAA